MADQKKIVGWSFTVLILLVVVVVIYKNWGWISGIFKGGKKECKESDTAFECIKKMGAKLTKTSGVGERYEYGGYGFYENDRAVRFADGMKGSYDKVKITWDNGTSTTLEEIFK